MYEMEKILQKIGKINEYLKIVDTIRPDCLERFDTDPIYRGALLHYLYLLADASIVLAEMIIKKKGLRIPQTYSEAFDILGSSGVLDREFAYSFARIAGFRNFLAHDYESIDTRIICTKILHSTHDIQAYVAQVTKALNLP